MYGTAESSPLVRWTRRLEESQALDGAVRSLQPRIRSVFGSAPRGSALRGEWLGHALLPVLTDLVIGTWTSATILDVAGLALWVLGLGFETIGDAQLARFKADPANAGHVMDRGLWRYTRHPNYFGDAMVWWGMYLVAAATPAGRWTILSPALMHVLLVRVSGVALLEKKLTKTRAGYADYVARTNAFLPWVPKRRDT